MKADLQFAAVAMHAAVKIHCIKYTPLACVLFLGGLSGLVALLACGGHAVETLEPLIHHSSWPHDMLDLLQEAQTAGRDAAAIATSGGEMAATLADQSGHLRRQLQASI